MFLSETSVHRFAKCIRPLIFFIALGAPDLTIAMDHSLLGELLNNHVKDGVVDYQGTLNGK